MHDAPNANPDPRAETLVRALAPNHAHRPKPTGPSAPLVLRTCGADGRESEAPMLDEGAGRAAWLAAVADPAIRYAALVRTSGPWITRWRCEWSIQGTFRDVTYAHNDAIRALLAELNASAGATSTSLATEGIPSAIILDGRIRFCGPTGTHCLGDVACNTQERVRIHWQGYMERQPSARTAAVSR